MCKAVVLAAGKGTRLLPLTGEVPKLKAPVAHMPITGHIFEPLTESGVREVHVNVPYQAHLILGFCGEDAQVDGTKIYLFREEELIGTAGGARRLAEHFDLTFVVVMCDALTDVDVQEVLTFHRERCVVVTLGLMRAADTSRYRVVELDREKDIVGFQEKPEASEAISNPVHSGIYVLEPEALEYVSANTFFDFAEDGFPRLLAAREKLIGYEGDFYWSDTSMLEAHGGAQCAVLSGQVRVRIARERWSEDLWVDRDAWLHPTASLRGQAVIGRDAILRARS